MEKTKTFLCSRMKEKALYVDFKKFKNIRTLLENKQVPFFSLKGMIEVLVTIFKVL